MTRHGKRCSCPHHPFEDLVLVHLEVGCQVEAALQLCPAAAVVVLVRLLQEPGFQPVELDNPAEQLVQADRQQSDGTTLF
eukprot:SAG22_NODE_1432_length_4436_cov_4.264007_4_plen_80_part_00